jgi:hypothetical protein
MLILNLEKELKINGLMFVCLFLNEIWLYPPLYANGIHDPRSWSNENNRGQHVNDGMQLNLGFSFLIIECSEL